MATISKKFTHEGFVNWLKGYVEITGGTPPDEAQWRIIVNKLNLVETEKRVWSRQKKPGLASFEETPVETQMTQQENPPTQ